jgi:hypothetical protein
MPLNTTRSNRKLYQVVLEAILCIRALGDYNGRWIKDEVIVQLFQKHSVEYQLEQRVCSVLTLNRSCGTARISCINEIRTPNQFGVFRRYDRQKVATASAPNNKCQYKKVYYYFIVTNINSIPHNTADWLDKTIETTSCLNRPSTRSRSSIPPTASLPFKHAQQSSTTHKRPLIFTNHSEVEDVEIVDNEKDVEDDQGDNKRVRISNDIGTNAQKIATQCKWDSPEALVFFVRGQRTPKSDIQTNTNKHESNNCTVNVRLHVTNQVSLLRRAYLTCDGWRDIVDDGDKDDECTSYEIFWLRLKARYLAVALTEALGNYSNGQTFYQSCVSAITKIDEIDFDGSCTNGPDSNMRVGNPSTIMRWFRSFRPNCCFPNPSIKRTHRYDEKIPLVLQNNPDLYEAFMSHARSNLECLSAEMMHHYLFSTAIPVVLLRIQKEKQMSEYTIQHFFNDNNLTVLTTRTVSNWMLKLGFVYSPNKKTYYVDSHEKPDNIRYRMQFIDRYRSYEINAHRWIAISLDRYERMVGAGELSEGSGYRFEKGGVTYMEMHVDDNPVFQEECSNLPYGAHLSVRKKKEQKPVMMLGQDECIFKQFALTKKSWSLPDGTRQLLPKDDGHGIMVSAFTCRELGYGVSLTPAQLSAVNLYRRKSGSNEYKDKDAAMKKMVHVANHYLQYLLLAVHWIMVQTVRAIGHTSV